MLGRRRPIRESVPPALDDLMDETIEALHLREQEVVKDYNLTRCLYRLAVETDGTGRLFPAHKSPSLAKTVCAFGGGTSLVSAWDVSRRYSEDLDVLCLMTEVDAAGRKTLRAPHRKLSRLMFAALDKPYRKDLIRHRETAGFRETKIPVEGVDSLLKIESVVQESDGSLVEQQAVTSLMGRFASAEQLAEFPALGGFEMPCVTVPYTAANKFDALHWRTTSPGSRFRGRDLYDLHAIAQSPHADAVRARVPELADRAATSPIREKVDRPAGGYGRSIVFQPGTTANEALRKQYESTVAECVWDATPPSFEEAVAAAASLDID